MLIIGLCNRTEEHKNTVHNIGEIFIESMIKELNTIFQPFVLQAKKINKDNYTMHSFKLKRKKNINLIILNGYINETGNNLIEAGHEIDKIIEKEEVIAVYDDIGINTEKAIVSYGKGSSRHNGARGIDELIGKEYWRIRIGCTKPEDQSSQEFVVSKIKEPVVYATIFNIAHDFLNCITKSQETYDEKRDMQSIQCKINTFFK